MKEEKNPLMKETERISKLKEARARSTLQFMLVNGNRYRPKRVHATDVGVDLYLPKPLELRSDEPEVVPLDIVMRPPDGTYIKLCLRSSLAAKYGLAIPNGFGVIDPSYCGPEDVLKLIVVKTKRGVVRVQAGTRIAQVVLASAFTNDLEEVDFGGESRGGVGSTGV